MVYMTYWFLAFAFGSLLLFWLIPPGRLRSYFLLFSCVFFHGHFAGPAGVIPIVVMGLLTFFAGNSRKPKLLNLAMLLNVLGLVYYKYMHFLVSDLVGVMFPSWVEPIERMLETTKISAPLAISFFTFEFVHYLYDVKKGSDPIKSFKDFTFFAIFWPSIVAGPVKRYQQFLPQVKASLQSKFCSDDFLNGSFRIFSGILKKILADNITAYIAFADKPGVFESLGLPSKWMLFFFLAFRIYFDFSGYSDLAIGYAKLMRVKLPENFDWPYLSKNISDFWRRWHISLSSWIRDYIYIPLGGSRSGPKRKAINGLLAFFICGLWHGSAWNFALWGIYHGLGLTMVNVYRNIPGGSSLGRVFDSYPVLAWFLNFLFVCVGWVYFFYPVTRANTMLLSLIGVVQ